MEKLVFSHACEIYQWVTMDFFRKKFQGGQTNVSSNRGGGA